MDATKGILSALNGKVSQSCGYCVCVRACVCACVCVCVRGVCVRCVCERCVCVHIHSVRCVLLCIAAIQFVH